jgi:dihydroxy-acid dehydratase
MDVSAVDIAARKQNWKLPEPRYTHGVLAKYARLVTGAEKGAVTEP